MTESEKEEETPKQVLPSEWERSGRGFSGKITLENVGLKKYSMGFYTAGLLRAFSEQKKKKKKSTLRISKR